MAFNFHQKENCIQLNSEWVYAIASKSTIEFVPPDRVEQTEINSHFIL